MNARKLFLTAEWRYLAMLNYEINPALLAPLVPRGTELDLYHGKAYVSMVGFRFLAVRLLGLPVPFHTEFDEVNLRFYVRRVEDQTVKRGTTFVCEIVPKTAIARTARLAYNENYIRLPMRHSIELAAGGANPMSVEYQWKVGKQGNHLRARCSGSDPAPLQEGSHAQFIAEHYFGYSAQRDGGTVEYRVAHPAWRVWEATSASLNVNALALYGRQFVDVLLKEPVSAFVAEGSAVTVFQPKRIET